MFQPLPGFRDFYPAECARRNHLFRLWRQAARRFGFSEYDVPVLEPLDLFTEKSGPEIVSQLFNFTDKGGREVSLRPELTPSLARLVGSKANALKRPIKWFGIGENFRYERMQKGRLRSHYQWNCDIFGEPGPGADAELISLCLTGLAGTGLGPGDIVLRLSDRQLWAAFLETQGITGEGIVTVLGAIDKWERTPREKTLEVIRPVLAERAEAFLTLAEELTRCRSLNGLSTFLRPLAEGSARKTIETRLAAWEDLLRRLKQLGFSSFIRVDLGIVRGLAYYTGFVFEVFELTPDGTTGRALAGGGRYDHLVERLGYPSLPAVGFGMGDVTLGDLLESRGLLPDYVDEIDVTLVSAGGEAEGPALRAVTTLRAAGFNVTYSLKALAFGKQFKLANQSGARLALILGEEEVLRRQVRLRDMRSGHEILLPASKLVPAVAQALEEGIPASPQGG